MGRLFLLFAAVLVCYASGAPSLSFHLSNIVGGEDAEFVGPLESGRRKRSFDLDLNELEKDKVPIKCTLCASGVNLIRYYIGKGKTTTQIIDDLSDLCNGLRFRPPEVCGKLFHLIGPEMVDILRMTSLTSPQVCSFVFNVDCGNGVVPGHKWNVTLPTKPKPPVAPRVAPLDDTPKLKVLHISDTHFDPLYEVGSRDICDFPMCCRKENGMAMKNESAAGKWGGWKCDIPERTLDNMLEHIVATHGKFDYILWTGDIPPHATWKQTREDSLFMLNATVTKIRSYFPDTPIFPALGNHESSPPHNFPSPAIGRQGSIKWLYDALAQHWEHFLPKNTMWTIKQAGYYVTQAKPRLKIISLNTNFCYYNNWWLIVNSTDPANQLQWFINELEIAELNGEKVHVIAHIPPGYFDCLKIWSSNYNKIISRFEETVTAQFFGHTHTDEIEIYYDTNNNIRPVSVGYVAPAVTTHIYMNPGYRIYTIDGEHNDSNWFVTDFETWVMNLTDANLNDNPSWHKMFSARDAYKLKSLLPEDWHDFYERLKTDDILLEIYDRHYWKDSPKRPPCGEDCRITRLCDIRSCIHYGNPNFTIPIFYDKLFANE